MDLAEFLKNIAGRKTPGGIFLAERHLRGLAACAGDGACRSALLDAGTPAQWADLLEKSKSSLVYQDDDMVIDSTAAASGDDVRRTSKGGPQLQPTAGACLDFNCVVTTSKQDREGDILEAGGAELDERAPLLWQHVPMLPVGKHVAKTKHTKSLLTSHCAIVNSSLGRDAAQLVEFDALRISHGFLPIEFEPLKEEERAEGRKWGGWRVKRYKILEISLVSVPASDDAVITAHSRGKLTHPFTKSWAEALWQERPARAFVPAAVPPPEKKCGCADKAASEEGEAVAQAEVEESWGKPFSNEHSCRLRAPGDFQKDTFRRVVRKHDGKEYSVIMGRLKGETAMTEQAYRYKKDVWKASEAKAHCKAHEGGTFEAASETAAQTHDKAGKISKRNRALLAEAHDLVGRCAAADGIDAGHRAMLKQAHGHVGEVLKDTEEAGGEASMTAERAASVLLARLLAGDVLSPAAAANLARAAGEEIRAAEGRSLASLLAL